VRAAVYTDAVLRRTGAGAFAGETFVVFVAGLRDQLDGLVLVGRLGLDDTDDPDRPGRPACPAGPGAEAHPYRLPDGVEVVGLPHYATLTRPAAVIASAGRSIRQLWRALDGVDVVWLLGPHPVALLLLLVAAARRRRIVLGVRQDMPAYVRARHPRSRAARVAASALERAWLGLARLCPTVVVGPDLARRYRHARSLLPVMVSLVEDGDLVREPDGARRPCAGPLTLLSVGRLDPEKNPLLLAAVLARLRAMDPRWRLVVCGDGSLAPALADALVELGVAGHADLLGFRPLSELRWRYRESHALLHVSWTEGVPQVLFEAFAAGLPVVATDVGGVASAADGAALLVPPGDADAAAGAVARLADDGALRAALVRRGLAVAGEHTGTAERRRLAAFLTGAAA
jgi:glycosyltransferase involved in cell wall biosynthesis